MNEIVEIVKWDWDSNLAEENIVDSFIRSQESCATIFCGDSGLNFKGLLNALDGGSNGIRSSRGLDFKISQTNLSTFEF